MSTFLHVLLVIAIILVVFFVLTFVVYIFNLDMKLLAALEPAFLKHYDKVKRDKHLYNMKLYDGIIEKINALLNESKSTSYAYSKSEWPVVSERSMIFRSDMAYELGADLNTGIGATILTDNASLVNTDEVIVIGSDLSEIKSDGPYIRLALIRVAPDKMGEGNKLYNAIKKMEYVRYHFGAEGFMVRASAAQKKESVRISKDAIRDGITFSKIGNAMIEQFHENEAAQAVKIIFITDKAFPYKNIEKLITESDEITETIDHILKDLKMDCDICSLKQVCDEVEGLRELHFNKEV